VDDGAAADFPAAIVDDVVIPESSATTSLPAVQVFDKADIDRLARQAKVMADREHRDRLEAVVKRLRSGEEVRKLGLAPTDDQLDALRSRFPNLSSVTDFVIEQAALARLGDGRFQLPPLLLLGSPGVGKTAWCEALAAMVGVTTAVHDMASVAVGAGLSGSDAYWANTRTGIVFDMVVWGDHANPFVIIDELDKAGGDGRYDPVGPLYRLLEPASARKFEDLSLPGFRIDASWLNIVATGNECERIPGPILSRFQRFDVPAPTRDEVRAIAQHVYRDILGRNVWGSWFQPALSDDVLDVVSAMAPRAIRKLFGRALGIAARTRRDHILPGDIKLVQATGNRRMGFV
jgi:ATP-dependent Lon protease